VRRRKRESSRVGRAQVRANERACAGARAEERKRWERALARSSTDGPKRGAPGGRDGRGGFATQNPSPADRTNEQPAANEGTG
jgi:hypothetical protein